MNYKSYNPNDFASILDNYTRGKQIQHHTFHADFTAENLFWSLIGKFFQLLAYVVVYPVVYIIVSIYKATTKEIKN